MKARQALFVAKFVALGLYLATVYGLGLIYKTLKGEDYGR